jgi:ribosomal protein S18 acetylase RimI-like enzyme
MVLGSWVLHSFSLRHSRESGNLLLRELGTRTALVTAIHDNEAARSLYESVDFYTINRERLYAKKR